MGRNYIHVLQTLTVVLNEALGRHMLYVMKIHVTIMERKLDTRFY